MRGLAFSIASLLATSSAVLADDDKAIDGFTNKMMGAYERQADKDIQDFCADKWPDDFSMQNFCYEKNVEARDAAQAYDLVNGPKELMGIWGNCSAKWTDKADRTDWEMLNFCVEEQIAALKQIQKRQQN